MGSVIDTLAEKTFDNFKKITPALTAIALLTGMMLFLPKSVLDVMYLSEIPVVWKQIIGIAFLLSLALIVTILVFSAVRHFSEKRRNKRIRENLRKKLKMLSPRQNAIIMELLRSEDKTISLDKNSGDTIYLVNNLFLHMPQQAFTLGWNNEMVLTYVPQPWLLDLYNEEPELFK